MQAKSACSARQSSAGSYQNRVSKFSAVIARPQAVAIQCGDGLAGAVWMAASAYGLLALARCLLGTYRVR